MTTVTNRSGVGDRQAEAGVLADAGDDVADGLGLQRESMTVCQREWRRTRRGHVSPIVIGETALPMRCSLLSSCVRLSERRRGVPRRLW